jgi:hypothetical protein
VSPGWRRGSPWIGNSTLVRIEANSLTRAAVLPHSSNGKAHFSPSRSNLELVRFVARPLDEAVTTDKFYFRVIINPGEEPTNQPTGLAYALIGFTKKRGFDAQATTLPKFRGFLVGIQIDPKTNSNAIVLIAPDKSGIPMPQVLVANPPSGTKFVLLRGERKLDHLGKDHIKFWVDPEDISSEERAGDTSYKTGELKLDFMGDDFSLSQLVVLTQNWPTQFYWDEVLLSRSFEGLAE